MDKKIGLNTASLLETHGELGAIDVVKSAGADCVDFFTNGYSVANPDSVYSKSDDEIIEHFSKIRRYANEREMSIYQTHGRMRTYLNDPELNELAIENARRDLLAAKALGAECCVMHGVTTSTMGVDCPAEIMRKLEHETFLKILPYAKEYGVKFASETFGYTDSCKSLEFFAIGKEFIDAHERLWAIPEYKDSLAICVDTGHCNTAYRFAKLTPADYIRTFGKRIACLHMHDNDGIQDQHLPLYSGSINWDETFDALDEIGFSGVYNLEINCKRYGLGFEAEAAAFAVKVLKFALEKRYG